jgi:uncharacterized membrane protein
MFAKDYRQSAWKKLDKKWGVAILSYLVYSLIYGAVSSFTGIGGLIVGGPLVIGYIAIILTIVRGGDAKIEQIFDNFSGRFVSNMALFVLQYLYTFLWTMLFIIPGIVKSYSYAMSYYIMCDNPEMGANEAITRSREMMNGQKWQLFCLHFSFIGWILLSMLTCGLLLFMVTPYMNAATAEFYEKLKRDEMIAMGINPDATFEEAPAVESADTTESI